MREHHQAHSMGNGNESQIAVNKLQDRLKEAFIIHSGLQQGQGRIPNSEIKEGKNEIGDIVLDIATALGIKIVFDKEDLKELKEKMLSGEKLTLQNREIAMKLIKENLAKEILKELDITDEVLAIFPYGSHVYGTATKDSDRDYIIVMKSAMLSNGAFRNNAISSIDWSVQGVVYSRGGFIDAINRYEIGALECISLPEDGVIYQKWQFKVTNWNTGEMVKAIVRKASDSRHYANMASKNGDKEPAIKSMYHAFRILKFGLQLKEHHKIIDFQECNEMYKKFMTIKPEEFDTRDYFDEFDDLLKELRS